MSDSRYHSRVRMSRKKFWMCVAFCVFLFLVVLVVMTPVVMKCQKSSDMITAVSNSKQIFLLLVEFDGDFGEFPSDKTAVMKSTVGEYANGYEPNVGPLWADLSAYHGEYSNDYLGQLIAGGYTQTEEIFYAKGGSMVKHRPDNDISTRAKILEAGECGFAYVKGLNGGIPHHKTPILMAAMYGGGYRFNPNAYAGKGVVLRVDGSVNTYRIDKDHHLKLPDGKTLFEGGPNTLWGEVGFDSANLCYAKYPYEYEKGWNVSRERSGRHQQIIWYGAIALVVLVTGVYFKRRIHSSSP